MYSTCVMMSLQVILMSATVDPYAYTRYFSIKTSRGTEPAPAIAVQGRTYEVTDFCLNDIKHVGEVSSKRNMWDRCDCKINGFL